MDNLEYRTERDSMGEVHVPKEALYGAQTQRSLNNFHIGSEKMPYELICELVNIKSICAYINFVKDQDENSDTYKKGIAIMKACDEIKDKGYRKEFPLSVWQTGSGTQTNMNVNEVISNIAVRLSGDTITVHPNDDVNKGQSTNDVFPTAICLSGVNLINRKLIISIQKLIDTFRELEIRFSGIIKSGRTHMQDATPIKFSQEISAWRSSLEYDLDMIKTSLEKAEYLPIGGTAVGTGINSKEGFDSEFVDEYNKRFNTTFKCDKNKFHGLSSKDTIVFCHGALKALSCDLFKIANDIRLLSCGPRTGIGEITIPSNEPGSSIMPGKVNPTQCEALIMVCMQVMGNDTSITFASAGGILELNVCMPLIAYNLIQSINILSDGIDAFNERCASGIVPVESRMSENLEKSLMNATILNPVIGYENVAKVVKYAFENNISLKESSVKLGYLTAEQFDEAYDLSKMV